MRSPKNARLFINYPVLYPALLLFVIIPGFSHADLTSDSGIKKNQIRKIETDLSREKENFLKFGEKEKSLLGQLSRFETEIAEKKRFLEKLRKKIRLSKNELKIQNKYLRKLDQSLKDVEDRLGKRLIAFYKYAKRGYVQFLATSSGLEQLRKRLKYLKVIMDKDQRLLQRMAEMQLRYKREISQIKEKLTLISSMEEEENRRLVSIKEDIDKKIIFLMKVHKEKEFHEIAVKELELAAENLKETLLDLDKDQGSQRQLLSSIFASSMGKLPFPFSGEIIKNSNPLGAESNNINKGIYIKGPLGAKVRAIFPGRVDFSGWLKGYGQIIVINHGSRFFTISAHLSKRNKEVGDTVKEGEVIGLLGQSGSLAGTRLYFEIRKGGEHLDPFKWLKVN